MLGISLSILDMVLDLIEKDFFSLGNGVGSNVTIFGVNMSSSPHTNWYKEKRYFNLW